MAARKSTVGPSTEVLATSIFSPLLPRADYPCASHAARNAALASCEGTLAMIFHAGPRLSHEQPTSRGGGKGQLGQRPRFLSGVVILGGLARRERLR